MLKIIDLCDLHKDYMENSHLALGKKNELENLDISLNWLIGSVNVDVFFKRFKEKKRKRNAQKMIWRPPNEWVSHRESKQSQSWACFFVVRKPMAWKWVSEIQTETLNIPQNDVKYMQMQRSVEEEMCCLEIKIKSPQMYGDLNYTWVHFGKEWSSLNTRFPLTRMGVRKQKKSNPVDQKKGQRARKEKDHNR